MKKCAQTCGNAADTGTCACDSFRNGASANTLHLSACQKREIANGVSQTICMPGPCASDWTPCQTMSPPPPSPPSPPSPPPPPSPLPPPPSPPSPPPPFPPCTAQVGKKNTVLYHTLMTLFAESGGTIGCDDVTTGYDAGLRFLTQCQHSDGSDNHLIIGPLSVPMRDVCPEVCGARHQYADCHFANSPSDDNDSFMMAYTGLTCADVAASPSIDAFATPGAYCDHPLYSWVCGASCRGGVAYDECTLPIGQDKYDAECPYWTIQRYYDTVEQCVDDWHAWASDSSYLSRSAMGAGSCP